MFFNYEQLLEKLYKEGMTKNPDKDMKLIEKYGYSFIVHNFGIKFLNRNKIYENVELSDMVNLAEIDGYISSYLWRVFSEIEKRMKVLLIDALGNADGEFSYLKKNIYSKNMDDWYEVNKDINQTSMFQKAEYYTYRGKPKTDQPIPIWELINTMQFGSIIKMFKSLNDDLKINIIKNLEYSSDGDKLFNDLHIIKKFRNLIGHHKPIINGYWHNKKSKRMSFESLLTSLEKFNQYKNIRRDIFNNISSKEESSEKLEEILNKHYFIKTKEIDSNNSDDNNDVGANSDNPLIQNQNQNINSDNENTEISKGDTNA